MALDSFFHNKIESLKLEIIQGQAVLRRLEAQRNDYNSRVRLLREELGLLQQPGSYVGEVVKVMGTKKVLVKVHPEGKYGMIAFPPTSLYLLNTDLIPAQSSILQTASMSPSLPSANECLYYRIHTSWKRCCLHPWIRWCP
jgi:ATP-dependent 26S proteasome regulatory subunit